MLLVLVGLAYLTWNCVSFPVSENLGMLLQFKINPIKLVYYDNWNWQGLRPRNAILLNSTFTVEAKITHYCNVVVVVDVGSDMGKHQKNDNKVKTAQQLRSYQGKPVDMLEMCSWWGVLGRCWGSLESWRSHYHTKATLLGNLCRRRSPARGATVTHWQCHKCLATPPHRTGSQIHRSLIFSPRRPPAFSLTETLLV